MDCDDRNIVASYCCSYTAVADYPSALASYFQCMSIPAQALSQVVVCAVKKARLVALIHYGSDIVTSMYVFEFLEEPEYVAFLNFFLFLSVSVLAR